MQSIWSLWKKSIEHFSTATGKMWFLASLNTWQRGIRILFKNPVWLTLLAGYVLISTLETYSIITTTLSDIGLTARFTSMMFIRTLCSSMSFIIEGLLLFFIIAVMRPSIEPKTYDYFLKYLSIICTKPILFIYWIVFSFYSALYSPFLGIAALIFLFLLLDVPQQKRIFHLVLERTWRVVKYTFPMIFVLSLLSLILETIAGLGNIFIVTRPGFSFVFVLAIQIFSTLFLYGLCKPIILSLVCCWLVKFKHEHPNLLLS